MSGFYRLQDDVHVPGRWHLGDIRLHDGEEVFLNLGQRVELATPPFVAVSVRGRALEFSFTSFAVPVTSAGLGKAMSAAAPGCIQPVPLRIDGYGAFDALNVIRAVDCLDERHSEFVKWTHDDERPDLEGEYRSVSRLCLDAALIPEDAHVFHIARYGVTVLVSQLMKSTMESVGCLGARFVPVASSPK